MDGAAKTAIFPDEKEDHVQQFFEGGTPSPGGFIHNDGEITSVYAPVLGNTKGNTISVIGVDYYTKALRTNVIKRVLSSTMTILALFYTSYRRIHDRMKNICIQSIEEKLQESENLLKNVFQRIR